MNTASATDALLFLSLLARPGDVFELRGLSKGRSVPQVTAGYFDDMAKLAAAAVERSGKDDGVYITINPVNPALLARAPANRVRQAGNGDTTSDRDVQVRRHMLVDIDPVRPAGISSTEAEHIAAIDLAARIAAELAVVGWPDPIHADSGNGGHLIYAIDLPVDDGGLIKRTLAEISRRYSTPKLKVDEKVFNPARISKIYGTLTRKGENTSDRPHRLSRIIQAPAALVPIPLDLLNQLAPRLASTAAPHAPGRQSNGHSQFNLDSWIAEHLPDAVAQPWSEGRKWLLPICPFNSDHNRREAYITEKHGGMIAAGCQHESCFKSWRDLRLHFQPDAYEHKNGNGTKNGNGHVSDRQATPAEVLYEDADYQARQNAEIDRQANADRDPPAKVEPRKVWHRAPDLVSVIMKYANEPWIGLTLATDEIVRVRAGGTAVVMGGSGSGKSSLVSSIMYEHARDVGPAIACSIELPADEFAGRVIGIRCDASWEMVLRGQVALNSMIDALALPRLFVLERRDATLENLARCIDAARAEFPGQPILVAIDYAQLVESKERETRQKVSDALARIDDLAREKRVVMIAVSQMSRNSAKQAKDGEKIGAESADGGAESAAIERFATVTLSIGASGQERPDGSRHVELSIGKGRMSGGDRVIPMSYTGRSGLWRVAGEAKAAADVRADRATDLEAKKQKTIMLAIAGAAAQANEPISRDDLMEGITGKTDTKRRAIVCLLKSGGLVEVQRKKLRSKAWLVWTVERATAAGIPLVSDMGDDR